MTLLEVEILHQDFFDEVRVASHRELSPMIYAIISNEKESFPLRNYNYNRIDVMNCSKQNSDLILYHEHLNTDGWTI